MFVQIVSATSQKTMPKILVVDDLAPNRELIREALDDSEYEISEAATASDALERLQYRETDLVITDVRMPGMSGVELLKPLHRDYPDVVVVLMSAFASVSDAVEAMKLGAHHYLSQLLDIDELKSIIQQVLGHRRLNDTGAQRPGFEKILGHSKELLAVLDQATRAAKTSSTVLIQGETGTGKELLARGIHFSVLAVQSLSVQSTAAPYQRTCWNPNSSAT
jgi:DNA-binding NtrC family response regulator